MSLFRTALPTIWTLYTAFGIFLYQLSSALLIRAKARDASGTFALHQLLNVLAGAIAWYLVGYAFSFGASLDTRLKNRFIGNYVFALHRIREANHNTTSLGYAWFFQSFCYAMVCNSIVAEALGTRASRLAHVLSTVAVTGFLFPVIAHWVWSSEGWLAAIRPETEPPIGTIGAIDFAGSGVVHLLGGAVALASSVFFARSKPGVRSDEDQPSLHLAAFLRIFVMMAYVTGSSISIQPISSDQSSLAAVASALNYDLTKGLPVSGPDWPRLASCPSDIEAPFPATGGPQLGPYVRVRGPCRRLPDPVGGRLCPDRAAGRVAAVQGIHHDGRR